MDVSQLDDSRIDKQATEDDPGQMIETKFSQTHAEQPNFSDSNAACDAQIPKRRYSNEKEL